jgi:uncharacterized protein (TIGR03905 family)
MEYHYKTKGGVCSRAIDFIIKDGIITNLSFEGGCRGNTQGVSKLAEGMKAEDVIRRLKGIKCGFKKSSCPDQLALAIEEALSQAAAALPDKNDA